jgi:Domain of unknown function (DUF4129)
VRLRRTLASCIVLGILVVVGSGIEGTTRFTGPRWVPHWNTSPRPAALPPAPSPPRASLPPAVSGRGSSVDLAGILRWVAIGLAVVIVAFLTWRWLTRRVPRSRSGDVGKSAVLTASPAEVVPEPEPEAPVIRRGVEQALRLLDEDREPADAIMRAWLGLQQTAEDSGMVRAAAETPTEFTSRIMGRVFADDSAIKTLLGLYLRTRFGDHPVIAADVATAREALQGLAQSWNATTGSTAAGGGHG